MKIAHLILAHKNPGQLLRLVKLLLHAGADCWIHLDKKCNMADFATVLSMPGVYRVEPQVKVEWGCYNIVQATLNSMKAVINSGIEYDYINCMSGQDYPLKPGHMFSSYLSLHSGYEFIGNRPYEESEDNIVRIRRYYYNHLSFPGKRYFEKLVNMVLPERILAYPYRIRKGPQWMCLTRSAVKYTLDFESKNPLFTRFFKTVHAPDEFFFQTILYNSPFRPAMRNEIFHYIDWSEKRKNPKTLTVEDLDKLMSSPLFFARKFDTAVDASILDKLDERMKAYSLRIV